MADASARRRINYDFRVVKYSPDLDFKAEEAEMQRVMTAVKAVRNRRSEMNVAPSKKAQVIIDTPYVDTFTNGAEFFKRLASASEVKIVPAMRTLRQLP